MRTLITGGSGFIGSRLVELLAARHEVERIVVADLNPPRFFLPKVRYERLDVRDGAACQDLIARCAPDTNLDLPFQFVHEEDAVEAIGKLLLGRHEGTFNVAADALLTLRECAEIADVPVRRVPKRVFGILAKALWAARVSEAPPGQIRFTEHPWVASNEKVKQTLGWQPKHSSRTTFELTIEAHKAAASTAQGIEAPRPAAPVA